MRVGRSIAPSADTFSRTPFREYPATLLYPLSSSMVGVEASDRIHPGDPGAGFLRLGWLGSQTPRACNLTDFVSGVYVAIDSGITPPVGCHKKLCGYFRRLMGDRT